jgi:hypothetical protein
MRYKEKNVGMQDVLLSREFTKVVAILNKELVVKPNTPVLSQ